MDDLDFGATIKGFSPGQKVFNRYTLTRILGRGGMGVVWLARDEELERNVALKFLPEVVVLDREAVDELKRETRRNLELTHPHIVRIYDFVSDGRAAAISMEYVEGASLSALKVEQPEKVFPVEKLRRWVAQVGEALEYAHTRAKVVHRDIKPANLMIDAQGDVKVTDFGIARSIADSVSRVSAQLAGSSGTPVYMSPQQMMGENPAVADDVYALGATLYELLTGKPPFYTGNVVLQVQHKVPPTLAARREELGLKAGPVPEHWEKTIAACLAKEPAERPKSMAEVVRLLDGPGPGADTAKDPSALFEEVFGKAPFTKLFDEVPGSSPVGGCERGTDLHSELSLTADELAKGGERHVHFPRAGQTVRLVLTIPPQSRAGQKLRIRGQGGPGVNGGEAGDLYIVLQLAAEPAVPPSGRRGLAASVPRLLAALVGSAILLGVAIRWLLGVWSNELAWDWRWYDYSTLLGWSIITALFGGWATSGRLGRGCWTIFAAGVGLTGILYMETGELLLYGGSYDSAALAFNLTGASVAGMILGGVGGFALSRVAGLRPRLGLEIFWGIVGGVIVTAGALVAQPPRFSDFDFSLFSWCVIGGLGWLQALRLMLVRAPAPSA